jgi:lipid II:glycine glycyltransferase (peptidoglycan interpeptide bridge formation enzyme)
MVVKEIKNIIEYTPKKEFLQSWFYGEFLKKIGRKVIRLENSKGEQLQALISNFRFGKFAYIPRGEIKDFSEFLVYFKKQNFAFVRLENVLELKNQQKEKTFIIKNRQPKNTWLLNIEKEEDEILTEMHSKTRYNINLAERKGVKIVEEKNLESFWKLNEITVERNSYNSHPKEYVAELLKLENVYQLNAYFENSILLQQFCLVMTTL